MMPPVMARLALLVMLRLVPAAPAGVDFRVITSVDTVDVVEVSWTPPPTVVTSYHVRLIPGGDVLPPAPADANNYACAACWHNRAGARTKDTLNVRMHPRDSIPVRAVVRAVDVTGIGPFGQSAVKYLTRCPCSVVPPPVARLRAWSLTSANFIGVDSGSRSLVGAVVRDSLGNNLLDRQVSFTSLYPSVATVAAASPTTAWVTGLQVGADTIQLGVEGLGWRVPVGILRPTPKPATLFATMLRLGGGMAIPLAPGTLTFTATDSTGQQMTVTITVTRP